jgi:hypothetical protein
MIEPFLTTVGGASILTVLVLTSATVYAPKLWNGRDG